ncbi:MAG: GTPase HflX [Clostridiales bacterium]|jgi:GTP-binding protein HflX|nr:GTPase HflX [Clostridiales bacterium]
MIYGNVDGIKKTVLDRLEELVGEYDKEYVIDEAVLNEIAEISFKVNREVCVYISRGGQLLSVGVGDSGTVSAVSVNLKRSAEKLTGVRCFHTHLNDSSELSKQDMSALRNSRMDMLAAVNVYGGRPKDITMAFLKDAENAEIIRYASYARIDHSAVFAEIAESEKLFAAPALLKTVKDAERALLVCVSSGDAEIYLEELRSLSDTAGLDTVGEISQSKAVADKNFCVGRGKLDEIRAAVNEKKADIAVFDNELSGAQLKNIEEALGIKVIDRAMLILEIFARHAVTNEGKLQVELAKLKYTLPKLLGQGKALSRIGGGAGTATRGAGETKLETDRRHIKRTIFELTERIEKLKKERDLRRGNRIDSRIKTAAIVGYTNAGKSTLMNALAKSSVKAENKLFATLDPVTRKIWVDIGKEYLLTDTVGFIDRLPHELIDAFRSTLEEVRYADLLIHVVDFSGTSMLRQYDVVTEVLESLGAGGKPVITVYNKIDVAADNIKPKLTDTVSISAKTGEGIDGLRALIARKLFDISN